MSNMTPWFPPHIKPVHKGVYPIKFTWTPRNEAPMYAAWNGRKWSNFSHSKTGGWLEMFTGAEQKKIWRGFTEEQK